MEKTHLPLTIICLFFLLYHSKIDRDERSHIFALMPYPSPVSTVHGWWAKMGPLHAPPGWTVRPIQVSVRWRTVRSPWSVRPPVKTFGHPNHLHVSSDIWKEQPVSTLARELSSLTGRTVHSSTFDSHQKLQRIWMTSFFSKRTIRPLGPDRPPVQVFGHPNHLHASSDIRKEKPIWTLASGLSALAHRTVRHSTFDAHPKLQRIWTTSFFSWRTVVPIRSDR